MQDSPDVDAILAEVEAALRPGSLPSGLPQKLAANAVALARREITLAGEGHHAERARLKALLGTDGTLEELNARLADAIREGRLTAATPGLATHLWRTTIEKMRVDQPAYPAYAAWLGEEKRK